MSKMFRFAVLWTRLGPPLGFLLSNCRHSTSVNQKLVFSSKYPNYVTFLRVLEWKVWKCTLLTRYLNLLRTYLNISTCPLQPLWTVFLAPLVYFHIWHIHDLAHVNSPLCTNVFWLNAVFIRHFLFGRCASNLNKRGSCSIWWQPKWYLRLTYEDCGFALQITITQMLDILLSPTVSCSFGLGQRLNDTCRSANNIYKIHNICSYSPNTTICYVFN